MTVTLSGRRGWLADSAGASIYRIDTAFGSLIPTTSLGRTWAEQNNAYLLYKSGRGPLALPPGSSVHEKGYAADFGRAAWSWLGTGRGLGWNGARMNGFGWRRTVSSESWHAEYDENHDAALFQALLVLHGHPLAVDGNWGGMSEAALKDFQSKNDLKPDGEYGPLSLAKLRTVTVQSEWPARALYGEPWVVAVQDKLKAAGYDIGESDGKDGPRTQAAVKDVQTKGDLTVDGVAGPLTNARLDELLAPKPVGRNATDRPTVEIQKFLITEKYDVGSTGADGDYGSATTSAVMKYQADVGLTPDGVWGELTDDKAFPDVEIPEAWPVNGRNATTRPTKQIQEFLLERNISVGSSGADGVYGKDTSIGVAKYQDSVDLDADGVWGPQTDLAAFPGVPLPDAPADPTKDPSYGKKTPTYPGATWADVSPNKSARTEDVDRFYVHHAADPRPKQTQIDRFMGANDMNVSPNWFVAADGSVAEIVPPDDYRAWTTGQPDHRAVTVETQNTSGSPAWGVSMESHKAIAKLVFWASQRYDFPIDRQHVIGHREVIDPKTSKPYATACPGPAMNLDLIVALAQQMLAVDPEPTPEPEPEPEPTPEPVVDELLVEVEAVLAKVKARLEGVS